MNDAENKNGILVHNGNKYAVGLLWLANTGFSGRKVMQKRIQLSKGNFYIKRENVARQLGIGWLCKKHKNAMPAAAPMAADKLVGEWHGVFEAENGWWYLEVHSDNIAPRGDIFFFDEQEAKSHFEEKHKSHTWPRVYLPEGWDIDGEGEGISISNLNDILEPDNKEYILQPTDIKAFAGSTVNLIVLIVMLIGLAGGGYAGYNYLPEFLNPTPPPRPKVVPLPPIEEPKPEVEEVEAPGPEPQRPEESKVSSASFTAACGAKLSEVFLPVAGWPITTVACTHNDVTVNWLKNGGTLDAARQQGQKMPRDVKVTIDGTAMTAKARLPKLRKAVSRTWLKKEQAVFELEKALKSFGKIEISFSQGRPPSKRVNRNMEITQEKNSFAERDKMVFSLVSNTSPDIIATYMDLPALQLDKIEWSVRSNRWLYEGHVDLEILTDNN